MKMPYKIEIDILDFIKNGKFDFIKIGQTKEWILNNFPDPDVFGMGKTIQDAEILCYGNIEFHFYEGKLSLIHGENLNELNGGNFLKIKKWIFLENKDLTLLEFINELNIKEIDFTKKTENFNSKYVKIHILKSNIQFTFIGEDNELKNQNHFTLYSFSLTV